MDYGAVKRATPSFPIWLLGLLQMAYFYGKLPQMVAVGFDSTGQAEQWTIKPLFFLTHLALLGLILSVPDWITAGYAQLSGYRKNRKAAPFDDSRKTATLIGMKSTFNQLSLATAVYWLALMQLALQSNLHVARRISNSGFCIITAVFLIFFGVWILKSYQKFKSTA